MKKQLQVGDKQFLKFARNAEDLMVLVRVKDVKNPGYGRTTVLVTPVSGTGEVWVESTTLYPNTAKVSK